MTLRLLVWDIPEMLRGIIMETMRREPDVEVIATNSADATLPEVVETHRPDVIIIRDNFDQAGRDFVETHARRKVIVVRNEGRNALLYRLRPERVLLNDVSPEGIVRAIRDIPQVTR